MKEDEREALEGVAMVVVRADLSSSRVIEDLQTGTCEL